MPGASALPPPAIEELYAVVLSRIPHPITRAMYGKSLRDFVQWWKRERKPPLNKAVLQNHKEHLTQRGYSASSINQRLCAIRKLAFEAAERGTLPMIRGRPGPRRWLPSYLLAINFRCQRNKVSGVTIVATSWSILRLSCLALEAKRQR
jgi:hypothetical protein